MPQNSSSTIRTSSSLPETISVSIVGWKNKEKATEGLACKESSSLERNSNDSSAQLHSMIATASKNYMEKSASMITSDTNNNTKSNSSGKEGASSELNKNDDTNGDDNPQATAKSFETDQQVFVKRRYFPIAPDNSFVAPSLSQNTTNKPKDSTSSSNLEDVISITVLDEPTPQVRTKKMTSEADGLGNIVLPAGARIVGDKIVFSSGLSLPYKDYIASQQNLKGKAAAASKGGLWGEEEPSFEWHNDGGGWGSNNNAGGGWGAKNNTGGGGGWGGGGGGGWGSAATATKKAAAPKKKAPVDSSGWGAAIPTTTAPKKAVKSSKPSEFVVENDWEW